MNRQNRPIAELRANGVSYEDMMGKCCDSPNIVEAIDENGELIEPAYDICVNCGSEHH